MENNHHEKKMKCRISGQDKRPSQRCSLQLGQHRPGESRRTIESHYARLNSQAV